MRQLKKRKGELFGKQKKKAFEEDVMESRTMRRNIFLFESFVYI